MIIGGLTPTCPIQRIMPVVRWVSSRLACSHLPILPKTKFVKTATKPNCTRLPCLCTNACASNHCMVSEFVPGITKRILSHTPNTSTRIRVEVRYVSIVRIRTGIFPMYKEMVATFRAIHINTISRYHNSRNTLL